MAAKNRTVTPQGEHSINIFKKESSVAVAIYWTLPNFIKLAKGEVFSCPLESTAAFSLPGWKLGLRKYGTEALLNAYIGLQGQEVTFLFFSRGHQTAYLIGQGQDVGHGMYRSLVPLPLLDFHSSRSPNLNLVIVCRVELRREDLARLTIPYLKDTSSSLKDFNMFQSKLYPDIKLKRDFYAHSCILYTQSPAMLKAVTDKITPPCLTLSDDCPLSYDTVSEVLRFLYAANFSSFDAEKAVSLCLEANRLQVDDLKRLCVRFLKRNINVASFMRTYSLARVIRSESLFARVFLFFFANRRTIMDLHFPGKGRMKKPTWMKFADYEQIEIELKSMENICLQILGLFSQMRQNSGRGPLE